MSLPQSTAGGTPAGTGLLPRSPLPLIGREAELADLERTLATPDAARLVTLTGAPGVGKTRLAVAVAREIAARFADGALFVDLAPVRDPSLAIVEVARALGLLDVPGGSLAGRVVQALADKDVLLVVDNCEHVLAAGLDLAMSLRLCPRLRLLVTSRERLSLSAELEFPLPPLRLPAPADVADPARLAAVPAVAMLVERVRSVRPGFEVTEANAVALTEICVRLDGLPLALELAAARAKLFSPAELAARLGHRMSLLTSNRRDAPDRHRTLHAALEWSHDLLGPDERTLFRRLSVFVGDWTLEAAQRVCAEPGDEVLETVGSLVDKSLVHPSADAEPAGFVVLESLREYGAELLAANDDRALTRDRHAAYFTESAAAMEARIGLPTETDWWRGSTTSDEANLLVALDHCVEAGDPAAALRLTGALAWHSFFRGHLGAGRSRLDAAFAAAEVAPGAPPPDALAGALVGAGALAWAAGEFGRAQDLLARGLEISESAGDLRRTAVASSFLGHIARVSGRYDEAEACHDRAAALYRRIRSGPGYAWTRYDLGLLARRRGQEDTAARYLRDGLALFREIDYGWAIARCAWALATVCLRRSAVDEAADLLAEALVRHEEVGDGRGLAQCLESAAGVASARADPDTTVRLLGAAAGVRQRLGAPLPDEDSADHETVAEAVRSEFGAATAARRWGVGRDMPTAAAVALARATATAPARSANDLTAEPGRPPTDDRPLTGRERQVADLVAAGRTNRQIGRALGIAEKTVEVHVHHVLAKLGAQSRTEVATWVVTRHHGRVHGSPDSAR